MGFEYSTVGHETDHAPLDDRDQTLKPPVRPKAAAQQLRDASAWIGVEDVGR
jgi:hypothetical protein